MQGRDEVPLKRRRFLLQAGALGATALCRGAIAARQRRVVIVGGGWGGLAAARYLRDFAPDLEVLVLERNPHFWSLPLSNHWLTDRIDSKLLESHYLTAARAWGYRFVQTDVTAINREARRVQTAGGHFDYDWLILSVGIRHDYSAWFGDDREQATLAQARYPAAYTAGPEMFTLHQKLAGFRGGDIVMTIPPAPYRCPPAPFERAVLLADWLETRRIPGRLILIDPNPPFQEFQRIFREFFPERIVYRAQTPVESIDLQRQVIKTDFEEVGFSEAILMPPQQAGDLAWQADLIGRRADGKPTGWANADPLRFFARTDSHIYLIGDMIDRVSPVFGHYPKSSQMAVRQGRIVARQIAALADGKSIPDELPDTVCHIATRAAPPAALRLDFSYRLRGDGTIVQQMKTTRDPQPRGEDIAWLTALRRELFPAPD